MFDLIRKDTQLQKLEGTVKESSFVEDIDKANRLFLQSYKQYKNDVREETIQTIISVEYLSDMFDSQVNRNNIDKREIAEERKDKMLLAYGAATNFDSDAIKIAILKKYFEGKIKDFSEQMQKEEDAIQKQLLAERIKNLELAQAIIRAKEQLLEKGNSREIRQDPVATKKEEAKQQALSETGKSTEQIIAETDKLQREQKALQESIGKYNSSLELFVTAHKTQLDKLESETNNKISEKQSQMQAHDRQQPGMFSSAKTKQAWQKQKNAFKAELSELHSSKKKIHALKREDGIIKEFRSQNPQITNERDNAVIRQQELAQQKKEQEQQKEQNKEIDRMLGLGRGRTLGREF